MNLLAVLIIVITRNIMHLKRKKLLRFMLQLIISRETLHVGTEADAPGATRSEVCNQPPPPDSQKRRPWRDVCLFTM